MSRKLILYISMSIDGFLATKEDDLSWLSQVEREGEDYGYTAFTKNIDTYIVGRKTYDTVLKLTGGNFPQAEQYTCYVITRQTRPDENGVRFYNGDLKELIQKIKDVPGKDIYCDGGGQIVNLLMKDNLIDEYIISVIPHILGDGKRLFLGELDAINVQLKESKQYESGLVQLHYIKTS